MIELDNILKYTHKEEKKWWMQNDATNFWPREVYNFFFFFFFDRRPREVYNGMLQQQIHNILNIP